MPFARLNNQRLYYEDSGGDGLPVVMMHGFLMDQTMFAPQVAALSPDYRVIRFDARAFGRTEWDGQPFDLYDIVADCLGLLDHLDLPAAVLAGMSQGGYIALRAALRHPARVRGLVLMSTRAGRDEPEVSAGYVEMRDTWQAVGPVDPLLEGLATAIIGDPGEPAIKAHWDTWLPRWRERTGDQIFHAMNNLLDRDEIESQLSAIRCPALVTHGELDSGIPPALGQALCDALPKCRGFVLVPGAAHVANLTHPEAINPPLRAFLAQIS